MVTIFSIPKKFNDKTTVMQSNAIGSWVQFKQNAEVILMGKDEGVDVVADKFCVKHIPDIKTNEYGTPLLDSAFNTAQKLAKGNVLMYVNADIIVLTDVDDVVKKINKTTYLIVGRRWDLDVDKEINFNDALWKETILREMNIKGVLHGWSGIDYFIFPREFKHRLPEFSVGRPGWDNWLLWNAKKQGIPIIDATADIIIIHQNHDYSHSKHGGKTRVGGPETKKNFALAGFSHMLTIKDADYVLEKSVIKRPAAIRYITSMLMYFYPVRMLIALKRKLQNLISND